MTTTTVYSNTSDGRLRLSASTWANAQSGSGASYQTLATDDSDALGFMGNYLLGEGFYAFDTSGIADGDTVSEAVLTLTLAANVSNANVPKSKLCCVWNNGWDRTLSSGDYLLAASVVSANPMGADVQTTTSDTSGSTYSFTASASSGGSTATNVSKTSWSSFVVASATYRDNSAPTDVNYGVSFYFAEHTGTGSDPVLVVTSSSSSNYSISAAATGGGTAANVDTKLCSKMSAAQVGAGTVTGQARLVYYVAAASGGVGTVSPAPHMLAKMSAAQVGAGVAANTGLSLKLAFTAAVAGVGSIAAAAKVRGIAAAAVVGLGGVTAASPRLRQSLAAAVASLGDVSAFARPGGTLTVFLDTTSGRASRDANTRVDLDTGDATSSTTNPSFATLDATQNAPTNNYFRVDEVFLSFDTSALPDAAILTAATLSLHRYPAGATAGVTLEVSTFDWGASLTATDFCDAGELAALTRVGEKLASDWSEDQRQAISLTNPDSYISKTGTTRFVVAPKEYRTGASLRTATVSDARLTFYTNDTGTTHDAKLVMNYVLGDSFSISSAIAASAAIVDAITLAAKATSAAVGGGVVGAVPHMQGFAAGAMVGLGGAAASSPKLRAPITSSMTGQGAVTAQAVLVRYIASALVGAATISASPTTTILLVATALAGSGVISPTVHMHALAHAASGGTGNVSAAARLHNFIASAIVGAGSPFGVLEAIKMIADILGVGNVTANAIRRLYIQSVVNGYATIGTGDVFSDEGVRAANRSHGYAVVDGRPWYENLVRQDGV